MRRILRRFNGDDQGSGGTTSSPTEQEPAPSSGMGYVLAGMVVGMIVAAIIGLDFWPSDQATVTVTKSARDFRLLKSVCDDLERDLAKLSQKNDKAEAALAELRRTGIFPEAPDASTVSESIDADRLMGVLLRGEWRRFSQVVEFALLRGESGYQLLQEVALRALHASELQQSGGGVFAALSRVAFRRPTRTAELIGQFLSTPEMETDALFAQRVLTWAAWYFAVTPETAGNDEASRAMLVQSLQRRLLQGDTWISDVLASLEALDVAASSESIEALLEDDARARDHATLLKYLGRRADPESAGVLVRFIDDGEPQGLKTRLAMNELAARDDEAAGLAFKKLLESDEAPRRLAAHLAYFTVRSALRPGLSVLVDYLNSDAEFRNKERLLAHVRNVHPALYRALGREPGLLGDESLRAELREGLATLPVGF